MLAFFRICLIRCKLASLFFTFKCLENYNSSCSFRVCCRPPWICHTWLHTCTGFFFHDLYSSEFLAGCFLQQAFVVICHIIWATNFFHHFRTFLNALAFLFASVVVHATRERSMTPFLALQKCWKHWESEKYIVEPVLMDTLVIRTPINLGKFLVSLRIQHFFFKKKKKL